MGYDIWYTIQKQSDVVHSVFLLFLGFFGDEGDRRWGWIGMGSKDATS
jgi:hypothetical protein